MSSATNKLYLPSEIAQQLAQHIFNECGTIMYGWLEDSTLLCKDPQVLAQIIQEFYDTLP
jgi:hypothetical protein